MKIKRKYFTLSILIFLISISFFSFYVPIVKATANYEYDDIELIIKITGVTANLAGWYSEDKANGWNTIGRTSIYQYYLIPNNLYYVYIGDGSTETIFKEQVYRELDNAGSVEWYVFNNATLELGRIKNETQKTVYRGLQILRNYNIKGYEGSTINFYGCSIQGGKIVSEGNNRFWGCLFDTVKLTPKNTDTYSCQFNNAYFDAGDGEVSGIINNIYGWGSFLIATRLNYNVTISNAIFFPTDAIVYSMAQITPWSGYVEFINIESNNWDVIFDNDGDTGRIYEKYTIDICLHYKNGSFYEGANVTLAKYGMGYEYLGFFLTNSSGDIPTQLLTKRIINKTDSYSNNPFWVELNPLNEFPIKSWNFTMKTKEIWNFGVGIVEYEDNGENGELTDSDIIGLTAIITFLFMSVLIISVSWSEKKKNG